MATIKQIAQQAGVSPTTVSNVLHGRTAKVSHVIREKIQAIISEDKYAPNMGAIILARSNSRIIGVIIFQEPRRDETVLEDPFSSTILGALEHEIRESGYFMMLHTTSDEDDVLRLSKTWKLDGLIILWVPGEICRIIEQSVETPVVFVDCYFDDDGQLYHNVGLDDMRGGYEMCHYLLSKGHRKILFLANDKGFPGGDQARFEGCQQAYKELSLNFRDECFIPLSKDRYTREDLYRQLSARPLTYTALFFSADYYAAEAVSFFQEQGLDIPRELSVVGFDDNIFARIIRPHLTTVHQDVYQKGQSTVAMLMQLIRGEEVSEVNIRLPVRLTLRDSVQKFIES